MSSLKDNATIKHRRATASNWTSSNPTPNQGEWCLETDTKSTKMGDGSTAWNDLPYRLSLIMIAETDRPAAWVLSAGAATSYTDVDFGAYVPTGVKALLLTYTIILIGDNTADGQTVFIRKNGSSGTDTDRQMKLNAAHTNLAAGLTISNSGQIIVDCDTAGIIEYISLAATGELYLNIVGYYI